MSAQCFELGYRFHVSNVLLVVVFCVYFLLLTFFVFLISEGSREGGKALIESPIDFFFDSTRATTAYSHFLG